MVSYPASCDPCSSTRYPSPGLKLSNSTSTNTFASGWVCPCFSTIGFYTATGMLQLPFSITEEFKVGKARFHMMLRDSLHDVIHQIQPELRSGSKWSAAKVVQEAEGSLQIKVVIGATQTGRAGLGSTPHQWFSREDRRGHRDMVITELNMIKEKRVATVAGQVKQCAWMNWEGAEARKRSWSSLMTMYGSPRQLVLPPSLHLQPPSLPPYSFNHIVENQLDPFIWHSEPNPNAGWWHLSYLQQKGYKLVVVSWRSCPPAVTRFLPPIRHMCSDRSQSQVPRPGPLTSWLYRPYPAVSCHRHITPPVLAPHWRKISTVNFNPTMDKDLYPL